MNEQASGHQSCVLQTGKVHRGIQEENTVVEIRKAFLAGESQSSISRRFGVSKEVVRQVVRYITFKNLAPELKEQCTSKESLGSKALDSKKVGDMRTLYQQGTMVSELADLYGCTVSTVRAALLGRSKYKTDVPPIKNIKNNVARGERHPHFKLKECDVNDIRKKFEGGLSIADLAREYKVSYMHVKRIVNGLARLNG